MAWGIGGWLLTPFLQRIGAAPSRPRAPVAAGLKTTFASSYAGQVSLPVPCGLMSCAAMPRMRLGGSSSSGPTSRLSGRTPTSDDHGAPPCFPDEHALSVTCPDSRAAGARAA